jgi:iron(III) transport system ATP-binding protein
VVAAFFGTPNLLDASVEKCLPLAEHRFRLDVSGGGWRGQCEAAEPFPPGKKVTVMVRPEDARLQGEDAPAGINGLIWSGRIIHTVFRGSTRSVIVETDDNRLNVDAPAFSPLAVGDNVKVVVPERSAWAVASGT